MAYSIGTGMAPSRTKLGKFIRACRIKLGLSQVKVAKLACISQSGCAAFEASNRLYLSVKYIAGFSRALRCKPSQLEALARKKRQLEPKTELGKLIKARREELGLTMANFARKLKVSYQNASQLELRRRYIICQSARRLAKALQLEPQALIKFITNRNAKAADNGLGEIVRERRQELYLSQEELGKKLGISRAMVSLIELGALPLNQSDHTIKRLAEVLKLDIAMLKSLRPKRKVHKVKEEIRQSALGRFLTARRLELGLSQKEAAQRAGTSITTVHNVETNKIASIETLGKIAKALECKIPLELVPNRR